MSEQDFLDMRIGTFFLKLQYFTQRYENEKQFTAELIRLQTFHLINIQLSHANQLKKVTDLWRYSWEQNKDGAKKIVPLNSKEGRENLKKLMYLIDTIK